MCSLNFERNGFAVIKLVKVPIHSILRAETTVELIRLTLHLNEELCLNTASSLTLVLTPWAAKWVDLINEYNGRLVLPCKAKEVFYQPGKQKKKNSGKVLCGNMLLHGCNLWIVANMTHFSLSPSHLETRSDEEMEKKVELLASVATALAR